MAKTLTTTIQRQLNNKDVKIRFVLTVGGVDYSDYLVSWAIDNSKEFGAAQATFILNNNGGIFGEGGASKIYVGDVVSFKEYFLGDPTEFPKFYGIVNQKPIIKTSDNRSITLVCLDYISVLQFMDLDLECEGTKILVEDETLTPNYLPSPNESLAQIFNFANDNLADNPLPIVLIRNKDTSTEDPQYDGYEIMYENGQLKLGFPLNALNNYDVICTKYYFYTKGIYAEDIIEDILTAVDGYGNYLFGETSAANVITNHLTDTFLNVEAKATDTMTPNTSSSSITVDTTLSADVIAGATSISVVSTSGFPVSGQGNINGDMFTWSNTTSTTLTGIPSTGSFALKAHESGSYVEYEYTYPIGQVWYLTYSNIQTNLTDADFTIDGGVFAHLDKRNGRIILDAPISILASVTCDTNYTFKTLQASGIEINHIVFRSRETENRFAAIQKLREYLAPNYIIRTRGDSKIWSSYLSQKTVEDYTLQLETSLNYLEDEDLYTRVIFWGKNKNPTNLMFGGDVTFVGTGESYKATATASELSLIREEGNYYVYGSPVSGVGKITANLIKPIIYLNEVPIDNISHILAGQGIVVEVTTRTETNVEGGGK